VSKHPRCPDFSGFNMYTHMDRCYQADVINISSSYQVRYPITDIHTLMQMPPWTAVLDGKN